MGLIVLILLCVQLKLQFAVPLACIVFVSICLSPADEAFLYGINRLLDTTIGLATALVVNVAIKPYNNRARIVNLLTHFRQSVPAYVEERVLHGRYPDLSPLRRQLDRISSELDTFETVSYTHLTGGGQARGHPAVSGKPAAASRHRRGTACIPPDGQLS